VWDTARGDKPIHVLKHGFPVEEFRGDREREDTGVKFTAWGDSPDRFYTGSSDGVVKVWNVRSGRKPLVRDILEVPAPVSFGMFSPDRSKLVIGDASGRVFLLSIDEEDQKPAAITSVRLPETHSSKITRRPNPIIPHAEPEPPAVDAEGNPLDPETGRSRAAAYLAKGQLVLHRNPTVGVVQGLNYAQTGLFRREAHADDDPTKPLLARVDSQQQETLKMFSPRRKHLPVLALKDPQSAESLHAKNLTRDLDISSLSEDTQLELLMARVDLDDVGVPFDFSYEEMIAETEM
jgi:WD40 repeat protein